jgi:hypothetical protein
MEEFDFFDEGRSLLEASASSKGEVGLSDIVYSAH